MSIVETCPPARFEHWSRGCAERMSALKGVIVGGADAARDHIRSITQGRCRLETQSPRQSLSYAGATLRIGQAGLQFLRWESDGVCETTTARAPEQHLLLYIPIEGEFEATQAGRTVRVVAGEALVVGSAGELRRRWRGRCVQLNVVVPREALMKVLATEFGIDAKGQLRFEPLTVIAIDRLWTMLNFIETVVIDIGSEMPVFTDPLVAAQAHVTLLHIILKCVPHNHSAHVAAPQRTIAPYYVRRAEDHIARNIGSEISIETLAAVAGVSVRTIYYGFKQYRSLTPMKYLKQLRLTLARNDLLQARASGCKVAELAARYGYSSASQFSRDYKEMFGESPVVTLRGLAGEAQAA